MARIYDVPLSGSDIAKISKLRYQDKPFTPGDNGPFITVDQRYCFSSCTTNPLPGSSKALDPPEECLLGQGSNGGSENEGVTCEELSKEPSFRSLCIEKKEPDFISEPVECFKSAYDFEGSTGKKFSLSCPKDCANQEGVVVGT